MQYALAFVLCFLVGSAAWGLPLKGVVQSGAELGAQTIPGIKDKTYVWPHADSVQHFGKIGFGAQRLEFLWERLQPQLGGDFAPAYWQDLQTTVSTITQTGGVAILDPANFARYNGKVIGAGVSVDDFVSFWTRLAKQYKDNDKVAFSIMKEPNGISAKSWAHTVQIVTNAIRKTGAKQLILVPGIGYTQADSWLQSNADAFVNFTDPGDYYAFDMHHGMTPTCDDVTKGQKALEGVTPWLKQHGFKAFLGEFGGGPNSDCEQAVNNMLSHIDTNAEQWIGWTFYTAGPWWGHYFTGVEPAANGTDKPQTAWLRKHLDPTPVEIML